MKRFVPPLLVVALLTVAPCLSVWAQDAPAERIFPYDARVETLDNGLKVIMVPMSSEGLVAYWTIVRTGARDEYEPGHTGFAHFFEHMMFRGTDKYPQDLYNEIVTKIGADANAFTSDDLTAYHLNITKEDVEQVMQIESDRFKNLKFPEEAFKTEAGAVYGEYRKNRTNPFFTIYEAIHKAAFDRHTYGHTAMGYEQDIKAMPTMFDYSLTFFSRYYRPENAVLLIVGDIEPGETLQKVQQYYGDWQRGYVAPKVPAEPPQKKEKRITVPYEGQSLPILWIGYKAGRFDPADRVWVAGHLLTSLAFGETSDIHKKLVLDEQVVEFISGDLDFSRDPKLFSVITRVKDPAKVEYVEAEIDATIDRYRNDPVPQERLDALKSRLKYEFLMNLDTPDNVASALARLIAVTGGIEAIDSMFRTVESITAEDIKAAANTYLKRQQRTVATLRGKK